MLKNKVIFITGGSRGIGREIALRCARDGARIAIAAKSVEEHPDLPGTIYSVAEEITQAGGECLPIPLDIRDADRVATAVQETAAKWGGIDCVINNASAISLTNTLNTPIKRFDLMMDVNIRGSFATTQAALPFLQKAENPHILTLSPPLNIHARWFKNHAAYTLSKYGMSMLTLGMAAEFAKLGIAINSLWPKTIIATAAIQVHMPHLYNACRTPAIMADAAYAILNMPSKSTTGNFFVDEEVLALAGVTDFSCYALDPSTPLQRDLFLD
jgi:citronellol/citronellal dehydrogenase